MKYPQIRKRVIETLRTLSNIDYQQRVWVNHDVPEGYEDCFDFAVHLLFDDTQLADAPENEIGIILKDEREADAVRQVTKAIDSLLIKLGTERTDEEYLNDPDWSNVVEAARNALSVMAEPE